METLMIEAVDVFSCTKTLVFHDKYTSLHTALQDMRCKHL
jgi:hypothetical protein